MRVLKRGVELLAESGTLVYSTCSINPIENEAVIHRILAETNGALELVDVAEQLPGLKYSQGMLMFLYRICDNSFFLLFRDGGLVGVKS